MISQHWGHLTLFGLGSLISLAGLFCLWLGFFKKGPSVDSQKIGGGRIFLRVLSLLLLGFGLFSFSLLWRHAQKPALVRHWDESIYQNGGFAASFPEKPEFDVKDSKLGDLPLTENRMHLFLEEENVDLRAVMSPIPDGVDFSLEKIEEILLQKQDWDLVERKLATFEGRPVVDLLFKTQGDTAYFVKVRIFVMDGKYFRIIAVLPEREMANSKEILHFFDSVKPLKVGT